MRICLVLLILFVKATFAFGSGETRNGGNAVVCPATSSSQASTVQLFDYWEQSQAHGGKPVDLGPSTLSVNDKINLFLSRVAMYDPERADRFATTAKIILSQLDSEITDHFNDNPINDDHSEFNVSLPCEKKQFAQQILNPKGGEERFQINKSLWSLASNTDRAGIIVHEVVYREAIKLGARDSDGTRLYHYIIASSLFGSMSFSDFKKLSEYVGFHYGKNFPMEITNFDHKLVFVNKNDNYGFTLLQDVVLENEFTKLMLKKGVVILPKNDGTLQLISLEGIPGQLLMKNTTAANRKVVSVLDKIKLYPSGAVSAIDPNSNYDYVWNGFHIPCGTAFDMTFFENGQVNVCQQATDRTKTVNIAFQGQPLAIDIFSGLTFFENGALNEFFSVGAIFLKPIQSSQKYMLTKSIEMNRNGEAISGDFAEKIVRADESNHMHELTSFQLSKESNIILGQVQKVFMKPQLNGHRFVAAGAKSICVALDFEENDYRIFTSEDVVVTGTDKFYDAESNTLVAVTDNTVSLVKTIGCKHEFVFSF